LIGHSSHGKRGCWPAGDFQHFVRPQRESSRDSHATAFNNATFALAILDTSRRTLCLASFTSFQKTFQPIPVQLIDEDSSISEETNHGKAKSWRSLDPRGSIHR
jgi:hypothetical protein